MRINQNIAAFNAYRNLNQTQNQLSSSLEKLSSGFRINRAADDASGLVNSENLRSQIGGLKVATRNAQDAISLAQTAEGAQTEVHSILQRMRDLVVQSGNLATNDNSALKANQDEISELKAELTRIADQTQFGTKKILNGSFEQLTATLGVDAVVSGGDFVARANFSAVNQQFTVTLGGQTATITVAGNYSAAADETAALTAMRTEIQGQLNTAFGVGVVTAGQTAAGEGLSFTVAAGTHAGGATARTLSIGENLTLGLSAGSATTTPLVTSVDAAGKQGAVFQVGANATQQVSVGIKTVSAAGLGVAGIDVNPAGGTTKAVIDAALISIDSAIGSVSENRATLGAFQNRMESTIRNISVAVENLSAAESRIRDTDMAQEMVSFTRAQILSQAGTAMLAQANQVPQAVLSLLR